MRKGEIEHHEFLTYSESSRRSLVQCIGLSDRQAAEIGKDRGPLAVMLQDSRDALRALMRNHALRGDDQQRSGTRRGRFRSSSGSG
mgnify:CR=1 FL=1